MSRPTRALALATVMAAALISVGTSAATTASAASTTYTVTVGQVVSQPYQNDTPDSSYIDRDGTFHFQGAAADYGPADPRHWQFYSGTTFDDATDDTALDTSGTNGDTTALCNNSPTGQNATYTTDTASFAERNYCDLVGVWIDPDTGAWYGLVHNEFTPEPFPYGPFSHYDAIDYAKSADQGKTWTITGHAITSPYSTLRGDNTGFPNQTWDYGDGDPRLFVDAASGYFYVFYGSRIEDKSDSALSLLAHVARAPISGKMASGTWQKWYNGVWSQPGIGGLESNLVPVNSAADTGYTPPAGDYNPANTGTVTSQVDAKTLPASSPLFVMDVAYDSYLGLYIGEGQGVDQSGSAPQQYYATADLATQKWTLIGDTGTYHTASWYRWFVDSGSRTLSNRIIGKTFRDYCSFGCSNKSDGEYATVTINPSAATPQPVDPTKTYQITTSNGRLLTQVAGSSATTSTATATGSGLEQWVFTANGDGSYRITNAATAGAIGVDSASDAGRAWGAAPSVTAIGSAGTAVGQQWFIVADTDGTYRLVNRYSGLNLALSGVSGRQAETTPDRSWTDTTGSAVGAGRTAAEQTLTLTPVGTAPTSLNGTHVLSISGQALDDPNWATTSVQLITYGADGGANQSWVFTQQTDGSYQIQNAYSQLCLDDSDWSVASGSKVIQYACRGTTNQHWNASQAADGTYTLSNAYSGLLLTTADTSDLALVTQQTSTATALQHWTIK